MEILVAALLFLLLLMCSCYFSASEIAFFSLPSHQIKFYKTDEDPRKRLIANLLQKPSDLLVTIFILNTVVNILIQNVASGMFHTYGWFFKVGVPLVTTLVLGEIIPKYLGLQNNAKVSYLAAPSINWLQSLMSPIRRITIALTNPISRIMFFFLKKEKSVSHDELEHLIKMSEQHGALPEDEAELAWGYLTIQEAQVREIMRPREDILYYRMEDPLSKLLYIFVNQECSRVPVCQHDIQNIAGIIDIKQFFLFRQQIKNPEALKPFLKKPFYIPETTAALTLLKRLEEAQEEMAIAVDEYGSVTGLITREDLIEVVVGPITDQRDQKKLYTKAGENEIIASGKLELSEINEIFDVELTSENNMVTIGGWLTEQLGNIPIGGTKVELDNFLFHILSANPNRIRRVYIRYLKPNEGPK